MEKAIVGATRSSCASPDWEECRGTLNEPPPLPDPNATRPNPFQAPAPPVQRPPVESHSAGDTAKKVAAGLGAIGLLVFKLGAKLKFVIAPLLKFFPLILKTGGTMLLTIGIYAQLWGWKWAAGFVLLILVHECGHMIAARKLGLNSSWPMFIPFMGAFIALKDAPRNAWVEAWVGISGPLLGSLGALICHSAGEMLGIPLLIGLAWSAYWLNLFNLTPVGQLDGGHVATALSPWLWVPGIGILGWIAWHRPNFIIWMLLILAIPRLISLFRRRTEAEQRFYEVTPQQRWTMAAMYFGLIAALVVGMDVCEKELQGRGIGHRSEQAANVR
jgi:Zn-dependent protease